MSDQTVEARAVKIAARIMQAVGLCRYGSLDKCRRRHVDEETCDRCIEVWLIAKAREEMKEEQNESNTGAGDAGELQGVPGKEFG